MSDVDYARTHYDVAVKVWRKSDRWTPLFPLYPHLCALKVDAYSIAYDLAVAQAHSSRPAGVVDRGQGVMDALRDPVFWAGFRRGWIIANVIGLPPFFAFLIWWHLA